MTKKMFRIGLAGLGTVGSSVLRSLIQNQNTSLVTYGQNIEVVAVAARDRAKDRGVDVSHIRWYDHLIDLAQAEDVDCVVELIGGADGPALDVIQTALSHGKHVVTANKALLAKHGLMLAKIAEDKRVALAFEASVAGGIPIIKTLREALTGNRVTRISGILNGTCNYILSRMEQEGLTFDACLMDAQRLGYAEADPTFDIEGFDSAHKLCILASLAFGCEIDAEGVRVEGITKITPFDLKMAEELGFRIKLLGVAEISAHGLEQRVQPTMVHKNSVLSGVMGVTNAVTLCADMVGELTLVGAGAGGDATASAVLADIFDVVCGRVVQPFGIPVRLLSPEKRAATQNHEGGFYIRLSVYDRPGVAAKVTQHMAEQGISLESILQRRDEEAARIDPTGRSGAPVPVVLITYATTEEAVRKALHKMVEEKLLTEQPLLVRIDRT